MTVFQTRAQAQELFVELFRILAADPEFAGELERNQLTVALVHTKPDFTIYLAPGEVRVDDVPAAPVLTVKMSCDTAHALWSGKLLLPLAVATGKLRVRGSMAKVIEFAPLLHPAFDRYPDLAAAAGFAA
jgi:putative sterol carrier protein